MKIIAVFLSLLALQCANAAPVTFYDSNFDDGGLGGARLYPTDAFTPAENVPSEFLNNRALRFEAGDQLIWEFPGTSGQARGPYHYIAFSLYAEFPTSMVHFLDAPSILRQDLRPSGQNYYELYYDFELEEYTFVRNRVNAVTRPMREYEFFRRASSMRFVGSSGWFEIDNLLWQGGIKYGDVVREIPVLPSLGSTVVPVPAGVWLFISSLLSLNFHRVVRLTKSGRFWNSTIALGRSNFVGHKKCVGMRRRAKVEGWLRICV